jgi:hypothetical protein
LRCSSLKSSEARSSHDSKSPGGLLLVIPHLLEVPVSVLWVDCHLLNLKKQRFLELGKKVCLTAERETETKKHDMDFYTG